MRIGKNTKFIIMLLLGFMILTSSCRSNRGASRGVKEAEQAEKQGQNEANAEYQQAIKRHKHNQSKQTKASSKMLKKQQRRLNNSKRRSLWDRLFKNKCTNEPL